MKAFFDRFLPAEERATALWLALGGSVLMAVATLFGSEVMAQLPVNVAENPMPASIATIVKALSEFALVALAIALLIRFARAPRVLALYVLLASLLASAISVLEIPGSLVALSQQQIELGSIGSPGHPVTEALSSVLVWLGVGLGAVAGAWIASTVTLARIRDAGFSGDDTASDGLLRRPGSRGWEFVGWEGSWRTGDVRIAMALVAVAVIPGLAALVLGLVVALAGGPRLDGRVDVAITVAWVLVLAGAWLVSTRLITLRSGIVSTWVILVGEFLSASVYNIQSIIMAPDAEFLAYIVATSIGGTLLTVAAALLGTALALRRKPATLDGNRRP